MDQLRKSQSQETRIAKLTGGSKNAGSGNGWKRKHDVRSDEFLWEMKRTDKKQITVKLSDLDSVRKIAWQEGRTPVFHIELGNRRFVLLEESDFLEMLNGQVSQGPEEHLQA